MKFSHKSKYKTAKLEILRLQEELDDTKGKLKHCERLNDRYNEQLREKEEETLNLQGLIEDSQEQGDDQSRMNLVLENEKLKRELKEYENQSLEQKSMLSNRGSRLISLIENNELKQEIEEYSNTIMDLKAANEALQEKLARKQGRLEIPSLALRNQSKLQQMHSMVSTSSFKNDIQKLNEMEIHMKLKQSQIIELNDEMDRLEYALKERELDSKALASELKAQKNLNDERQIIISKLQSRIEELEALETSLEKAYSVIETKANENLKEKEVNQKLELRIQQLLADQQKNLSSANPHREDTENGSQYELRKRCNDQNLAIEKLHQEIDRLQAQSQKAAEYEQQVKTLRYQLESYQSEISVFRTDRSKPSNKSSLNPSITEKQLLNEIEILTKRLMDIKIDYESIVDERDYLKEKILVLTSELDVKSKIVEAQLLEQTTSATELDRQARKSADEKKDPQILSEINYKLQSVVQDLTMKNFILQDLLNK